MNSKKWRIGFVVALVLSLLTAGAGLAAGMQWQAFVAVFCAAAVSNLGAYLMKHPVESIVEETASSTLTTARDGSTKQTETSTKTTTPVGTIQTALCGHCAPNSDAYFAAVNQHPLGTVFECPCGIRFTSETFIKVGSQSVQMPPSYDANQVKPIHPGDPRHDG